MRRPALVSRLSFRGKLVTVGYSYVEGRKQPLTEEMRQILKDYQDACGPATEA